MKRLPDVTGRFATRLWFEPGEIDQLMAAELRSLDLYPTLEHPEVDIETFVELRIRPAPIEPCELTEGILGETRFEAAKVVGMGIARHLFDGANDDRVLLWRLRSTLAHECGHAILHPPLFEPREEELSLFRRLPSRPTPKPITCHDVRFVSDKPGISGRYDGEWWEYQANVAIGALLTPGEIFRALLERFIEDKSIRSVWHRPPHREEVVRHLSDQFNVSREVVRIRLDEVAAPLMGQEVLPNKHPG